MVFISENRTNDQFETGSIFKDNREIFTLASIYYNQGNTKGPYHSGIACYSSHPYRSRIISGKLTCHVTKRNLPGSLGSFRLISMTSILHPAQKEKNFFFTARSTMYWYEDTEYS